MSIFNIFKKKNKGAGVNAGKSQEKKVADQPKSTQTAPTNGAPTGGGTEGTHRVHNLIILDESGSMSSIYLPALTGVNETLQTIRDAQDEHKNQQHFVTLVTFDTGHYNPIYDHVPAEQALDITKKQYSPGGGTPLYDAMGRGLTELRSFVGKDDIVLVTIITDGYENASCEYNAVAIKALVESLKAEGWVFTYIGANQDVTAVAGGLSIDNHLVFESNHESTQAMFEKELLSRKRFFDRVNKGETRSNLQKDYFNE